MRAGELRHRVTIEEPVKGRNSFQEETVSWSEVADVWAAVEPLTGREYLDGRLLAAEVTTRIRMRYRSGVTPEMRVVWGSRVFTVESVINRYESNRELVLMCREAV